MEVGGLKQPKILIFQLYLVSISQDMEVSDHVLISPLFRKFSEIVMVVRFVIN